MADLPFHGLSAQLIEIFPPCKRTHFSQFPHLHLWCRRLSSVLHKSVVTRFTTVPRCCRHLRTCQGQFFCLFICLQGEMQKIKKKSLLIQISHHQITEHPRFPFPLAFNEKKGKAGELMLSLSPKIVVLTKLELSFWSAGKYNNIKTSFLSTR